VLRGLLARLTREKFLFSEQSPQPPELAKAFLDEEHCLAHTASEDDKAKLKAIRDRPPPAAKAVTSSSSPAPN
jgi:hypothetical protein